jgi:hypothetical protein
MRGTCQARKRASCDGNVEIEGRIQNGEKMNGFLLGVLGIISTRAAMLVGKRPHLCSYSYSLSWCAGLMSCGVYAIGASPIV